MINWRVYKWKLICTRFISTLIHVVSHFIKSHFRSLILVFVLAVIIAIPLSYIQNKSEPQENPVGYIPGRGGYLQHTLENLEEFTRFFQPHLPTGINVQDLSILSSTFSKLYPDYRILPPKDLWKNMLPTLYILNKIRKISKVELVVASAYRSTYVNRKSSGANRSKHLDFSALDIEPVSNFDQVAALLKHFWWEYGKDYNLGLGYYGNNRFHIDTVSYRRWKWLDSRSDALANYNHYFKQPLNTLLDKNLQ